MLASQHDPPTNQLERLSHNSYRISKLMPSSIKLIGHQMVTSHGMSSVPTCSWSTPRKKILTKGKCELCKYDLSKYEISAE